MHAEEELIEGCKRGDRKSQRLLYDKYARRMFGVCMRYCDSVEDAEEVLQEGLLKVFQKISDFKGEGSLEGWIRRIMVNTSLDLYRKNKVREAEVEWQEGLHMAHEPMAELNAKELLKLIQTLPKGFRTVFNLYAIEGYTHAEIGSMLQISEGTSKSQYARARSCLLKMLNREEPQSDKKNNVIDTILPVKLA